MNLDIQKNQLNCQSINQRFETMPSVMSSNPSELSMGPLSHYCISLGTGPLWCSWCPPKSKNRYKSCFVDIIIREQCFRQIQSSPFYWRTDQTVPTTTDSSDTQHSIARGTRRRLGGHHLERNPFHSYSKRNIFG